MKQKVAYQKTRTSDWTSYAVMVGDKFVCAFLGFFNDLSLTDEPKQGYDKDRAEVVLSKARAKWANARKVAIKQITTTQYIEIE